MLSLALEEELVTYYLEMDATFYGLGRQDIRKGVGLFFTDIAYGYCIKLLREHEHFCSQIGFSACYTKQFETFIQ